MTDNNVVGRGRFRLDVANPKSSQAFLISPPEDHVGKFVFVDIERFDEGNFLSLIARNAVSSIVDVRPMPIFDRPRFNHKDVFSFLFLNNVRYIEVALAPLSVPESRLTFDADSLGLRSGLTMCIFDHLAKDRGWVDLVRQSFRRSTNFVAEVNPRALMGAAVRD
jgi:hypothetical protein